MAGLRLIAAAVVFAALVPSALAEQRNCGERDRFVRHLAFAYGERPIAIGLANGGGVIELLRSETHKTWTIIWTNSKGISCLIAAGEDWEPLPGLLVGLGDGPAGAALGRAGAPGSPVASGRM